MGGEHKRFKGMGAIRILFMCLKNTKIAKKMTKQGNKDNQFALFYFILKLPTVSSKHINTLCNETASNDIANFNIQNTNDRS